MWKSYENGNANAALKVELDSVKEIVKTNENKLVALTDGSSVQK